MAPLAAYRQGGLRHGDWFIFEVRPAGCAFLAPLNAGQWLGLQVLMFMGRKLDVAPDL